MTLPRSLLLLLPAALVAASLTACAGAAQPAATPSSEGAGHGAVQGAREVPEPPLALMSIDQDGGIGMLDLVEGDAAELDTIDAPLALSTDGRYGFAATDEGLTIVDSGRWSWDHGDHFHYYVAEPRVVGEVPGDGVPAVTTGMLSTAGSTGVFFPGSGEAVLLDNAGLADGRVDELFRLTTGEQQGIVAPLGDGALVTLDDELVFHDAAGTPGAATACVKASGAITTRVGVAIACADGAVVATWEESAPVFERVPYPEKLDAEPAASFEGRKGRPTVAAVAGADGFWLLDTRALAWQLVATEVALERVSAVDDDEEHVVALDGEGRVRVFRAGEEVAVTDPLVGDVGASVSLTVDENRAYLNDPAAGVVFEIDYSDGARVARTLETPTTPEFLAEVGR